MPSPIKPSDIKSTLPQTSTPVCSRLKNLLVDFPKAIYQWFSYMYNEDGTFTEEFKDEVCAIDCEAVIIDGPDQPCDPATEDCEDTTGNEVERGNPIGLGPRGEGKGLQSLQGDK